MSRNYDFILNLAAAEIPPPARLLDFGCGAGEVVLKALALGYDAHGADFYGNGWGDSYAATAATALGARLHRMPAQDRLPFADASFDIMVSNQVFEHIEHKRPAIAELARVLRPGGRLIAIFPTREVIIEPHLKTPFVHRLRHGGPAQRFLLAMSYRLGLAPTSPFSRDGWVDDAIHSLTTDIFYIRDRAVAAVFAPAFTLMRHAEPDFMRDRIATSRLRPLARLAAHGSVNPLLRTLCLGLANGVYVFSRR